MVFLRTLLIAPSIHLKVMFDQTCTRSKPNICAKIGDFELYGSAKVFFTDSPLITGTFGYDNFQRKVVAALR